MHKSGNFVLSLILLTSCLTVAADAESTTAPIPPQKGMFAQFIGVVHGKNYENELWKYISYDRTDFNWDYCQPHQLDQWNEKYLNKWKENIVNAHNAGVERLPILDYTNPLAVSKKPWSMTITDEDIFFVKWNFEVAGKRYDIAAYDPNLPSERSVTITNLKNGEKETTLWDAKHLPPENIQDWEQFVEAAVSMLSKPPYNVKYFQIWNEPNAEYWLSYMKDFVDLIYIPAAKIIRQHGCYVVFSGWADCHNLDDLYKVLNYKDTWKYTDILSCHYRGLTDFDQLYKDWIATNKCSGIWFTEVSNYSPQWIPNNYPRFFHWAITHQWQPNKYRIFQYAFRATDKSDAHTQSVCFLRDNELSPHGKALKTLGELLDAPVVNPFTNWQTTPPLNTETDETRSSIEGFHCGNRIVLACHFASQNGGGMFTDWNVTKKSFNMTAPGSFLEVTLTDLTPQQIKSAWRVGIYGSRLPLEVSPAVGNQTDTAVKLKIPMLDKDTTERTNNYQSSLHTLYLLVELK